MNLAALLGTIAAVLVLGYTVLTSTDNAKIFLDVHGIVIVIGGTIAVALLSFPFARLFGAGKVLFRKIFGKIKSEPMELISTIVKAADDYRKSPKAALANIPENAHPFLRDAMTYLVENGFNQEQLDDVLSNAIEGKQKRDGKENKVWLTISRFPPAFGLLGAVVGMIAMLQQMGEPGAQDKVGPAMATALVATFYGIATANLILIPIAENLAEVSQEDMVLRQIIKEGVLMMQEKKHPLYVEELLKTYLPPAQRVTEITTGQKNAA